MTEIDVPDWVVVKFIDELGKTAGYPPYVNATIQRHFKDAITAALGAWVVPTACTEPWRIDYLSSYPRNTVEVSSIDTLSAGDMTLYTLRQEKPE